MNYKCKWCGSTKPLDAFQKDVSRNLGHRSNCKSCQNQRDAELRANNRLHKNAIANKWYHKNKERLMAERALIRDKLLARSRKYLNENRKKINANAIARRKADPQSSRDANTRWRKKNLNYDAFRQRERRSFKNVATPLWAKQGYIKLFHKMAKAEEKRTGEKIHVDHIIPLKGKNVCGLHCEDNLQLLFAPDNLTKGNSHG